MRTDRAGLLPLADKSLRGTELTVIQGESEVRTFSLIQPIGKGKAGIAWKAQGSFGREWAIKFVLQDDYATHSLHAEATRVARLQSSHIARIDFYGTPRLPDERLPDLPPLYAIVVEWIDGVTLREFLCDNDNTSAFTVETFLHFARVLCEVLKDLEDENLSHNDLHADNLIVTTTTDVLTGDQALDLYVIDTGTMKTEERRMQLVETWHEEVEVLRRGETGTDADLSTIIDRTQSWISWFGRTDQEWVVSHLCSFHNVLQRGLSQLSQLSRQFLGSLPSSLDLMVDPDRSRRLSDPLLMYRELDRLWQTCNQPEEPQMTSPFELMSAELIRSDSQLLQLFSGEFPGLDECRSNDPVYIYGPRGCGKSTILRSLSLKALLRASNPLDEFAKISFVGAYVSCSSELRSRFWLIAEKDYDALEAHVVRYFNLLLADALVDTLYELQLWDTGSNSPFRFGLGDQVVHDLCGAFRRRIGLPRPSHGTAEATLTVLRAQIRKAREALWIQILDHAEPRQRTDAQLIFDLCQALEDRCPVFRKRRIAFLLDDYSSQRIPAALQRRLNQAITFAKQGSPIFKVTSEYDGVDLDGIQEGREVREVNIGLRYVNLKDDRRWSFLHDVLQKRFSYLGSDSKVLGFLPLSGLDPCVPMAREIRRCFDTKERFYYHGLDTISDLCSGDLATGLDLVRRIFDESGVRWRHAEAAIPPGLQHRVIERYAADEHRYIRYLSPNGRKKARIVDKLCWLARESVLKSTTQKDGKDIPLVKIHLDIAERALSALEDSRDRENAEILLDLFRKGILFPIDTSKSREGHQGTRRYQIRRILLPRYGAPLGRHTPIRLDNLEKLRYLITEPESFAKGEVSKGDLGSQGELPFGMPEVGV